MNFQQEYFTFKPLDYDIFAGLDASKSSISATFFCHDGYCKSLKFPYNAANLMTYVKRHYAEMRIAFVYEAGPTGFGLFDELTAAGYYCMVVGPAQTPQTAAERVRTSAPTV